MKWPIKYFSYTKQGDVSKVLTFEATGKQYELKWSKVLTLHIFGRFYVLPIARLINNSNPTTPGEET